MTQNSGARKLRILASDVKPAMPGAKPPLDW